jgi:hypothetical protein
MRATALILIAALLLAGCAHRPGAGSWLDAGSTYAALSSGRFVEANPLLSWAPTPAATALASLVMKQGSKVALSAAGVPDTTAHRAIETGGAAAGGWNLALLAGAAGIVPIIGGFGAGLAYWLWDW